MLGKKNSTITAGTGNDSILADAGKSDVLSLNKEYSFDLKFDGINFRIKTDKGTWITSTEITANSVSINFTDGGSIRIEGTANVTYQLADGSKYSTNHERLEWDSK